MRKVIQSRHKLTCTMICCFGKTKCLFDFDRSKDHSKTKYLFGFDGSKDHCKRTDFCVSFCFCQSNKSLCRSASTTCHTNASTHAITARQSAAVVRRMRPALVARRLRMDCFVAPPLLVHLQQCARASKSLSSTFSMNHCVRWPRASGAITTLHPTLCVLSTRLPTHNHAPHAFPGEDCAT